MCTMFVLEFESNDIFLDLLGCAQVDGSSLIKRTTLPASLASLVGIGTVLEAD